MNGATGWWLCWGGSGLRAQEQPKVRGTSYLRGLLEGSPYLMPECLEHSPPLIPVVCVLVTAVTVLYLVIMVRHLESCKPSFLVRP